MELTGDQGGEAKPYDCSSSVRLEEMSHAELQRSMLLRRDAIDV